MPDANQLLSVLSFVRQLPDKDAPPDQWLHKLYERYNCDAESLRAIAEVFTDEIFQKLKEWSINPDEIRAQMGAGSEVDQTVFFRITLSAAFLQLFAIGAEHCYRHVLPDLVTEAVQVHQDISAMTGEIHE